MQARLARVLNVEPGRLDLDEPFERLGVESLALLTLGGELSEWLGRGLPAELLWEYPSPRQLAAYLARGEGDAPAQGASQAGDANVLQINRGGTRTPLYFVPGGGVGDTDLVFVYRRLAAELGEDYPFLGLYAGQAQGESAAPDHAAALVDEFVNVIAQRQHGAPYYLAGECVGGAIAWQIAGRLQELGQAPRRLILMDAPEPTHHRKVRYGLKSVTARIRRRFNLYRHFARRAVHHLRVVLRGESGDRWTYLRGGLARAGTLQRENRDVVAQLHSRQRRQGAVMRHALLPYKGEVTLLVPERSVYRRSVASWQSLSENRAQLCSTPGDHRSYLREHVADTAAQLRDLLAWPPAT